MGNVLKTRIVESLKYDPWANLALEQYLLENLEAGEVVLYLWQNENTVVIGRNQNSWRECRTELLEDEDGKLARRLSGGGAVFHDLGNLNFTFVVDKNAYNLERQLGVLINALDSVGIRAEFSGRNDILAQGRKFSGNAFYHGKSTSLHHGTLLYDVDMQKLGRYLNVSQAKLQSKGVKSVRSRVINLKEIKPALTIEQLKEALKDSFISEYGGTRSLMNVDTILKSTRFQELYNKYKSWEWRYGKSPDLDITFGDRFSWGSIEIGLNIKAGRVSQVVVFSDAMDADLIEDIGTRLQDKEFTSATLANAVKEGGGDLQLLNDVASLIKSNLSG